MPQRELPLADSLGGIEQRFMDVFGGQVRMLSEDLVGRHPVSDHRHHRCDREAQSSDAWHASHDIGVRRNAFVGHVFMLAAADISGSIHEPGHTKARAGREPKRELSCANPLANHMREALFLFERGPLALVAGAGFEPATSGL